MDAGSSAKSKQKSDINVTPLIDIVLVLLIVFIVMVPGLDKATKVKVDLPKAATGDDTMKSTMALTLQRSATGYDLYANGEKTDEIKLRTVIPDMLKANKDLQTIIAADKGISYGDVVHIVDLVKSLGVHKFALNTDPN